MLNKVTVSAIFPTFLLIYSQLRVESYKESILKNVPKLDFMYRFTTAKCIVIHDSHFLRIVSALTEILKYGTRKWGMGRGEFDRFREHASFVARRKLYEGGRKRPAMKLFDP